MTSIHPPDWWKGPLGPLTSGRDFYEVGLRGGAGLGRSAALGPVGLARSDAWMNLWNVKRGTYRDAVTGNSITALSRIAPLA